MNPHNDPHMQTHTIPSEVVGGSASVVFSPRSLEDVMLSVVISSWKRQLSVNVATLEVGVASVAYLFYSLPKSRGLQQIKIIGSNHHKSTFPQDRPP